MTEPIDPAVVARSREIGNALQATVAAQPEIAASVVGMGIDALSSVLIHKPEELPGMSGWITLLLDTWGYVVAGDVSPTVAELLAGRLRIGTPTT